MPASRSFLISDLLRAYRAGNLTPTELVEEALARADRAPEHHVWITRRSPEELLRHARAIEERSIDELPLYGIPFVIKDNIDLAEMPTTAGCAAYSYTPTRSARVVQRLLDAGALPLGKTNLDQFATGLVGARSPYGACRNSFHRDFISGGSSSGSAVAVATGLASFSLGTDTAGSGRIPAAFNNIVGLKPSLGRLSTRGVVPACRSLDCVSIFALTTEDAAAVLRVAEGFDADDPFSRRQTERPLSGRRFGVPHGGQLQFFGDGEYARLFEQAIARIESLGGSIVRIDFAPFLDAAQLLYGGPWVAERYAALEEFIRRRPDALHPVTRAVIEKSADFSAVDAFKGLYRLMVLKRAAERAWESADVLLTPTAGTVYEIGRVEADPIRLNTHLGYYTNFMNLLDLAGVAVPTGFRTDGLPFGVTLVGRRGTDASLLAWGGRLHRASVQRLGALELAMPTTTTEPHVRTFGDLPLQDSFMSIAVCGAHMEGLPLNHQLLDRGGRFVRKAKTAARYRLFALPGEPARPGLVRDSSGGGSIELEIWTLRSHEVASFIEGIPAPLGLGKIELEGGATVTGFMCESYGTDGAVEITPLGGWRPYLASMSAVAKEIEYGADTMPDAHH
jgi:allophanate hydrolase